MSAEHPTQIGGYEILEVLDDPSSGTLYKAVSPNQQPVTLKVLSEALSTNEDKKARFQAEAEALREVDHPNVLRLLDFGAADEGLYFASEFCADRTLVKLLKGKRPTLPQVMQITMGICAGLSAALEKGVVHRDLAPHNVLVGETGSAVRLADFGLSRPDRSSGEAGTLTTSELSIGAVSYMAPELVDRERETDEVANIYSVGVMFYELLTGRIPVGRFTLPSQLNSDLPPELDPVILRCLAADPSERYSSMNVLLETLRGLNEDLRLGLVTELQGIGRSTGRMLRGTTRTLIQNPKARLGILAATAILAAGAVGAWMVLRGSAVATEQIAATTEEVAASGDEPTPLLVTTDTPEASEGLEIPEDLPIATPPVQDEKRPARPAPQPARQEPAQAPPASPSVAEPVQAPSQEAVARQELQVARDKMQAGLMDQARRDVDEFLAQHGDTDLAIDAYFLKAEIFERSNQIDQAQGVYVEIQSRFDGDARVPEAQFKLGELVALSQRDDDMARDLFRRVADSYPNSSWAPLALAAKGDLEMSRRNLRSGSDAPAIGTWRQLSQRYPQHPASEKALWYLGELLEETKEFEAAASAFASLGRRFPDTRFDAWWRAGQIYDRRLDDNQRAIAAYDLVPAGSEYYENAQKRLRRLR